MGAGSGIEWTEATWNPVTGCTAIASGCANCYAVPMTHRLEKMGQAKYAGLTVVQGNGRRQFSGEVRCHEDVLSIPLGWRKPRRVFVNSMSDLFHVDVPFEFIARVFAVMALCPQHTFQVLTKRPERMAEYMLGKPYSSDPSDHPERRINIEACELHRGDIIPEGVPFLKNAPVQQWPLANVWLGTSASTQRDLDAAVPHLLRCPAAVRFLSLEPLVEGVDLDQWVFNRRADIQKLMNGPMACNFHQADAMVADALDWLIVGGESGKGARPCNVDWIRSVVQQCAEARVPCFVKQLGMWVAQGDRRIMLREHKGGNPDEWPEEIRVRQWPEVASCSR